MRKLDTLVIGSGIGGSYSSILLSQKGEQVAVLSQGLRSQCHLPESWVFCPPKSLCDLGILDDLQPSLSLSSESCFLSADGKKIVTLSTSQTSGCVSYGDIVRVDRNLFDQVFLRKAREVGVELVEVEEISRCAILDSHVEISYRKDGAYHTLACDKVIDGSGKSACLANLLGLKGDETVLDPRYACFTHFQGEDLDIKSPHIVASDRGYLFCIPVGERRLSVGCVAAESYFPSTPNFESMLYSTIEQSAFTRELLSRSDRILPVIPIRNSQKVFREPEGARYRLIGDAAIFMDPFFCPGIAFALASAEQAVLSLEAEAPGQYSLFIEQWLNENRGNIYSSLATSEWNQIMRLFADPHLPYIVPSLLTQAFGQVVGKEISVAEGIALARSSYAN